MRGQGAISNGYPPGFCSRSCSQNPQQFPSLSLSLDLHPQPFPGADESVLTLATISALRKQHLMKGPGAGFPDLCLAPGFSSLVGEKWQGLHLCREAGFHFYPAASLTFDVCRLRELLAASRAQPCCFLPCVRTRSDVIGAVFSLIPSHGVGGVHLLLILPWLLALLSELCRNAQ